jgi:catalase
VRFRLLHISPQHAHRAPAAGAPSRPIRYVATAGAQTGAKMLAMESAVVDFVRDAFGHLKAIGVDGGGQRLLRSALI